MVKTPSFPTHFVTDRAGAVVWADVLGGDRQTVDAVQNASLDGFTYNDFALDHSVDDSYIREVDYCGNSTGDLRTVTGHHAYLALDDGRYAYLGLDVRTIEGQDDPVAGDTLEVMNADGTGVTEIWNAWDHKDEYPITADALASSFYPGQVDWTHCDTVTYSAERDSWILSCRNISTVIEIDQSGGLVRSFGAFGTYAIDGYEPPDHLTTDIIGFPHNAVYLPDGHLLLLSMPRTGEYAGDHDGDGHPDQGVQPNSLILELEVDDAAKRATIAWQFEDGYYAAVEGGPDRLPNGNTLINWGAEGVIQEVTADKTVVWQAEFGVGNVTGHVHALSGFYPSE
jgi:hypothetical protein